MSGLPGKENGFVKQLKIAANNKPGRIGLCVCLLIPLLALPIRMDARGNSHLPGLRQVEETAQSYYAGQLPKIAAATVFANVVSGALSLVEEAHFSVVVFSIAPGKLLSGLHDSIRQLNNALLFCAGMFATGTIIMGMLTFICFKLLIPVALGLRILYVCHPAIFFWAGNLSRTLATGAVLLWLFFPTTALINKYVQSAYLDERIAEQMQAMETDNARLQAIQEGLIQEEAPNAAPDAAAKEAGTSVDSSQDKSGVLSKGLEMISRIGAALNPDDLGERMKARISAATDSANKIVQSLIQVVVMFMLVTFVIPAGVLALFIAICRAVHAPRGRLV